MMTLMQVLAWTLLLVTIAMLVITNVGLSRALRLSGKSTWWVWVGTTLWIGAVFAVLLVG